MGILRAQDIEQLSKVHKNDPLAIAGGLSMTSGASGAYGMNTNRPPFYWMLRGNLNLKLFGVISAPLSISYSPQGNTYDYPFQRLQPFNQFGMSPRYKSITVHIGYRNMNLSSYSLSGNTFNGVGVEWNPKKSPWSAGVMYGRFARALNDTSLLNRAGVTLFDRFGYGGKVGYRHKQGQVNVIFFRAKDREDSFQFPEGLIDEVTPQENLVTGITVQQRLAKKVNVKIEYTRSAFTDNTLTERTTSQSVYDAAGTIFTPRQASGYSGALDATLSWNPKVVGVNLSYKRIDPDYQTLGIPFLNNDIEVSSIGLSKRFLKNKISAKGDIGLQRNNLDNTQIDKTLRFANNISVNYAISKKVTTSWSYANYTTNTTKVTIEELDSLSYFQVTNNLNGMLNFRLGNHDEKPQSLSAAGSFQKANDLNDNASDVRNFSVGYNYSHKASTIKLSARFNLIQTLNALQDRNGIGPMFLVGKSFFDKKLNVNLTVSSNRFYSNGASLNMTTSSRMSLAYTLKKAHSIALNGSWLHRDNFENNTESGEMQVSFSYNYRFSKDNIIKLPRLKTAENTTEEGRDNED